MASELDPMRRDQIIRLLQTRDQHLPQPVRRSQAGSGFVHDTLAPQVCPTCEGVDSVGCTGCGGRGHIEVRRRRDPYAVDKVVQYGLTGDRHEAARERDRQIDRLAVQTAEPRSEADLIAEARPEQWEIARRRMYGRYDYAALDRALERLRDRAPACCEVVYAVHVYGWQTRPGPAMSAVAEAGLAFLSERLPARLRAPAADPPPVNAAAVGRGADLRALGQRDARIRRRVLQDGEPVRLVAAGEGLSVSWVNRIVKGDVA